MANTEMKGSDLPLEAKYGHHNIDFGYHRRIYRVKMAYAAGKLFGWRE